MFTFGGYFANFRVRIYFGRMPFARRVPNWLPESQILRRHQCQFPRAFRRADSSHAEVWGLGKQLTSIPSTEKGKTIKAIIAVYQDVSSHICMTFSRFSDFYVHLTALCSDSLPFSLPSPFTVYSPGNGSQTELAQDSQTQTKKQHLWLCRCVSPPLLGWHI